MIKQSKNPPQLKIHLLARIVASCVACFCLANCTATKPSGRNFLTSYRGLKQESRLSNQVIFRGDLGKLSGYDKIYLEEVKVFAPDDMEKRNITEADLERLQVTFLKSLRDEIGSSRFTLAEEKGAETLSWRAGVVDIAPGKPALFAAGYVPYVGAATTVAGAATGSTLGAGSATIEAELLDSVTRERFYAGIDEDSGHRLQITQGLTRWGHIEAAFREWSRELRRRLQDQQG